MTTLEQHVIDALHERDPHQSEKRVKEAIAGALAAFDPSATVKITTYFNHTYAPDMVLRWAKDVERPVFLRFTDNLPELGEDISMLDKLDPLIFGLTTPELSESDEDHLDETSRQADVLLTTPAAVEELTTRESAAPTDRMLRNSLAHAGRGALVGSTDARDLADTFAKGFTDAAGGQVTGTREALNTIEHFFGEGQARRLNRVVQAVWEGGGSRLDQYPGDAELSSDVGSLPLLYLVQLMDTDDEGFWRGVGRNLTIEHLFELATADVARTNNFQHLVNANLDVLRARACQVVDMRLLDEKEPPELRWGVDLPVSQTPPALTLRGPGFHAFAARTGKLIESRLKKPAAGILVEEYVERTQSASVASVSASVGGTRLAISDDSGTTDSDVLTAATSSMPLAMVDKATVTTPTGRITIDFTRSTGIGVTKSDTLLAHVLLTSVTLLVPMDDEQQDALSDFLTVGSDTSAANDDEDDGQPAFDDLDDMDEDLDT